MSRRPAQANSRSQQRDRSGLRRSCHRHPGFFSRFLRRRLAAGQYQRPRVLLQRVGPTQRIKPRAGGTPSSSCHARAQAQIRIWMGDRGGRLEESRAVPVRPEAARRRSSFFTDQAPEPGSVLGEGDAPVMARPRKYPEELRERAVRLVFESGQPIAHVDQDLGVHKERCGAGCGGRRPTVVSGAIC